MLLRLKNFKSSIGYLISCGIAETLVEKLGNSVSNSVNFHDAAINLLGWWESNGVSVIEPVEDIKTNREPPKAKLTPSLPIANLNVSQNIANPKDAIAKAEEIVARCTSLESLRAALDAFDGCALKPKATQMVFADGALDAPIMAIGEAPGRDEDEQGKPFVGVSGQLLDRMFASIGLDRKTNLYITNCVNWRPPGNRTPTKEETTILFPFLQKHIELKNPKAIILVGAVAANTVLNSSDGINKLRKKAHVYKLPDGSEIPVYCIFHPSYLLKRPIEKSGAWKDLLNIKRQIKHIFG